MPLQITEDLVYKVTEEIKDDESEGYIDPALYVHRMNTDGSQEMNIRLYVPNPENESDLLTLAFDIVCTALSDLTNNDACDICLRIRTAHFSSHPDIPAVHDNRHPGELAVIDAFVLDSLT